MNSLTVLFKPSERGAWSLPLNGWQIEGLTWEQALEVSRRKPGCKVRWICGDEMQDFIDGSPV
jgi:hypothetical protein